jgi:hypothetical protein
MPDVLDQLLQAVLLIEPLEMILPLPRSSARKHVVCREVKSDDAHADAPVHAADQRLFKEAGKPGCIHGLHFMHYNFCRVHETLRVTPAMQAGIADHVWNMRELIA